MLETVINALAGFIVSVISTAGYPGVLLLMAIESACIPLPSEVIMPFAGYLVYTGRFNLYAVAAVGEVDFPVQAERAGEDLEPEPDAVGVEVEVVQRPDQPHEEAAGLAVVDGAFGRREAFTALRAALVVLSLAAAVMVFRVGDLGAKAVWQGRIHAASSMTPTGLSR